MVAVNPRFMDIHELSALLGVAEKTIRSNRDHPLYSKALKLGGKTSPLKWRRSDVADYFGFDVASVDPPASHPQEHEANLLQREAEVARRERAVADALAEIREAVMTLERRISAGS